MSLLLKHREKDNKWRVWTTISDGWLTSWLSEKEVKQYLVDQIQMESQVKAIKEFMTFPDGWTDYDSHKRLRGPIDLFYEWQSAALKSEDYREEVQAKYLEIIELLK